MASYQQCPLGVVWRIKHTSELYFSMGKKAWKNVQMKTIGESITFIWVWNLVLDVIHCKKCLMWNDYWRLCCCKAVVPRLETLVVYCSIILSEAVNHIINLIWRVHTQRGDGLDASTCVSRAHPHWQHVIMTLLWKKRLDREWWSYKEE